VDSSELRALKRSYESDLRHLRNAKRHLETAKKDLKDDHNNNSLVKILEENVVVDDKYYEKDEIEFSYYSISDAIGLVAGYITSVERTIGRLEEAIERAEAEEAAESGD